MIFGRHINRYYLKYGIFLLFGLLSLVVVDWLQLVIPNLYQMIVNGMNQGFVMVDGARVPFDMDFLLNRICMEESILFTSGRVPKDMVEKTVRAGIPVLVSKSVATKEAADYALACGLQLIWRAWPDRYEELNSSD